jgi:hypothetical protein
MEISDIYDAFTLAKKKYCLWKSIVVIHAVKDKKYLLKLVGIILQ